MGSFSSGGKLKYHSKTSMASLPKHILPHPSLFTFILTLFGYFMGFITTWDHPVHLSCIDLFIAAHHMEAPWEQDSICLVHHPCLTSTQQAVKYLLIEWMNSSMYFTDASCNHILFFFFHQRKYIWAILFIIKSVCPSPYHRSFGPEYLEYGIQIDITI